MLQRLNNESLASLPAHVRRPAYNRTAQRTGIVHFGIGAFHRAHQAVYTDDAVGAGDGDWAITAVSLRSSRTREALHPQDGLYSLLERNQTGERARIVGAVREVLVAQQNPEAVVSALASPNVHVVTFTVTEKGYLFDPTSKRLLTHEPDLADDLSGTGAPRTIYGFLEHALARRRAAGRGGLTLLSCDNLSSNGRQLAALLDEYLERRDPTLAYWARMETACPCTMVDRIVPATTSADLEHVAGMLGVEDRGAVLSEAFSQWVIEDRFAGPRPKWEAGGAQFVSDVRPFETAKLRMLNGAHSTLAYVGLAFGFEYVHQAVADADLNALVRCVMEEASMSLGPLSGQDLAEYADALLHRFANTSLEHRLIQIAMDGTQKIPQRWLASIGELQRRGKPAPMLLFALAAWIFFVCTPGRILDDPFADRLTDIGRQANGNGKILVHEIVGARGLFGGFWCADSVMAEELEAQLAAMAQVGIRQALRKHLDAAR